MTIDCGEKPAYADIDDMTKYLEENKHLPVKQLKNYKLDRVLTADELKAVRFYVNSILNKKDSQLVRELVVIGDIPSIVKKFKQPANSHQKFGEPQLGGIGANLLAKAKIGRR